MLLELEKYGIKEGYFQKKRLNQLSEANSDGLESFYKEIIDFDETGEIFRKSPKNLNVKSADILFFINNEKNRFIELKNIDESDSFEKFEEHIKSLKLNLKVNDSFVILDNIVNETSFGSIDKREKFLETNSEFIFSNAGKLSEDFKMVLNTNVSGFEDYHKTLKKVYWIETKNIEEYL